MRRCSTSVQKKRTAEPDHPDSVFHLPDPWEILGVGNGGVGNQHASVLSVGAQIGAPSVGGVRKTVDTE